ncbi:MULTISPECIES: MurR/RpiR family transcriptional regulator [Oceanithermus]|uniref:RpiR family transcriptional regulator n=2 Tax=Oceanithermus desulfurans TaxID=227924 RepID=A0A511RJC9_9DEIN|nr:MULTISPECIES: MurR/RpiR family transcriptional regulator [Oceanithermus]MBB6029792.1 DNA-binding MurR/RpiR family transcriptional regulator [Oceanithermus desulfurans]GEM89753.1 RpiR family transcriptional regulator [Oceanithermus desulfurans NBRC 100063]
MATNARVLSRINSFYDKLSPSERRVADYVREHPEQVIHMPLAKLAQQAGVSDPSVLRFCRAIGYRGYLDFKVALTQDLASPVQFIHETVNPSDGPREIAQKVFAAANRALLETLQSLDVAGIERVVDLIDGAKRTLIIGVGTSAPIAQTFYNRLFRLGLPVWIQTDSYLQLMHAALLGPDDVVVGISQTGASTDPVLTLEEAKKHGAATVAITGSLSSPITQQADVTLYSSYHELRPEAASSRIAQIAIVETIYVALSMRRLKTADSDERRIWEALSRKTL